MIIYCKAGKSNEDIRVDKSWEDRVCMSFLNPRVLTNREQESHESWKSRICMRVFSTSHVLIACSQTVIRYEIFNVLIKQEKELHKNYMRVDESW